MKIKTTHHISKCYAAIDLKLVKKFDNKFGLHTPAGFCVAIGTSEKALRDWARSNFYCVK